MKRFYMIVMILGILLISMIAYTIGSFTATDRLLNMDLVQQYIEGQDQGCDRIEKLDSKLYCMTEMTAEDQAVYVLTKTGSKDDY